MQKNEYGAAFALILSEIKAGLLPSTIVLYGKDEASRHKTAILCAQALMCEGERDKIPCGACGACRKMALGRHPDVTVLSPVDGTAPKVDDVRRVRTDVFVSPFEADKKVVIFEMAHMLNVQSQNALLKILEEPPKNVYFILSCPSSDMLLPTVSSRCAKFSLGALGYSEIYSTLRDICTELGEAEKESVAAAISYLEGFELTQKNTECLRIALGICRDYYGSGSFPFEKLPAKKEDSETLKLILGSLALCALEIAFTKKGAEKRYFILPAPVRAFAMSHFPLKRVFSQYEFFCELRERLEANANVGAVLAVMRSEPCISSK